MKATVARKVLFGLLLAVPTVVSAFVIGFRHVTGLPAFGIIFNLLFCGFLFVLIRQRMAQRDRAEKTLRESEKRFRQLVNHAGDIIYRTDRDGRFTFINQTVERLMGYQPEDLLGRHFLEPVTASARSEVAEFYRQQFAEKTANTFHYFPARRKDGSEVWIAQNVQLLFEGHKVVGAQGVARDATERVQLLEELARARDAALEAARLRSEFVANTSHEIRTPMHSIIGMTQLLADTELDDEQRTFVNYIRQSADGLLGLINHVLDFSKIEAGRLHIEPVDFNLPRAINTIINLFREAAESTTVELISTIGADVPTTIHADSLRLRQVLVNLIGNGLKFTHEGKVVLSVECTAQTNTSADLRFEVTDTGIGISAAMQEQLFSAFVQADGSSARRYGGTGLGLAIAKELVEAMGGQIGVDSRLGEGSTFWFSLSVQKAIGATAEESVLRIPTQPAPPVDEAVNGSDEPSHPFVSNSRLLVVEDNPINQEVARYELEKIGYSVDVANNSAEALAFVDTHNYALILMDCHLPDVDGFETTARVRHRVDAKRSVPIMAVTASISPRDRERAAQAGMDDFLLKPFRREELSAKIEQWVSHRTPSSEHGASVLEVGPLVGSKDVEGALQQLEEDYGHEMMQKIIDMFLPDAEARIARIRKAIQQQDYRQLEEAAHGLKSGAANIGAREMTDFCARLESMGETQSMADAEVIMAQLLQSWNSLQPILVRFRRESLPSG